jgi:uncharacterized membrane protein YkvA (DUF1232 family)
MKTRTAADANRTLSWLGEAIQTLRLCARLFVDRRVPLWTKAVPVASLAYLLWPIDLIADPLLALGQLDDLAVMLLGIKLFIDLCPYEVVADHRQRLARRRGDPSAQDAQVVDGSYRIIDEE